MKHFKRTFICLCLCTLLISLLGCSNSNSADKFDGYYQVGETFTVSHSDKVEYEFTILEFTDEFFTVQVTKKALTEDADIYIYSAYATNFDRVISNNVVYDETWLPTVFPIGVFEVPLKDEDMVLQIYFMEEDTGNYQGYVKATIDSAGSSPYNPWYAIKFIVG